MTDATAVQVPAPRAEDSLIEATCRAFFGCWSATTLAFPGASYVEVDGLVRARTGLPVPPFNGVWATTRDVTVDGVLAAVDDFAGGPLPWNLQLRPGYPAELDAELAARGLASTVRIPFMVLTDPARVQAVVAGAGDRTLRPVMSFSDLSSALALLEQGFSMPPALTRVLFPIRLFTLDGATAWVAATESQDVSTALGMVLEECCGVFNVATPEAQRGHGHGAVVTAQAVMHGFATGA